jgi:Holliday junction resolvase
MADTPEKKVKRKALDKLKAMGAYHAMPVASGYGNSGVPDILCCYKGRFVGIECKANGGKPTALQLHNLNQIEIAGGLALIIDENNVHNLGLLMDGFINGGKRTNL